MEMILENGWLVMEKQNKRTITNRKNWLTARRVDDKVEIHDYQTSLIP